MCEQEQATKRNEVVKGINQQAAMCAENAYMAAVHQISCLDFVFIVQKAIKVLGYAPKIYFSQTTCIGVPATPDQVEAIKKELRAAGFIVIHVETQGKKYGTDYIFTVQEAIHADHIRPKTATVVFEKD